MGFAENIRKIRKEKGLSQEELAQIMDVSRQAVSKWEQGDGYPEVEKLLQLSRKLSVSLDALMAAEMTQESSPVTGSITITSLHENVVTTCDKVMASQKMKGGKGSPQYALFGAGSGRHSFWGEATVFLGWYANEELLSQEISEIQQAIQQGIPCYTLRYSAKTKRKWLRVVMVDSQ